MAKPENTTTIEDFIKAGKDVTLTYDNLSFKDTLSNGTIVSILNVIDDYIDELKEEALLVTFSTEELRKYEYKPKLLSIDIYGNPELYYIILLLNDMADVKEFNKKSIYMIPKHKFFDMISNIYNAEKRMMDIYNNKK